MIWTRKWIFVLDLQTERNDQEATAEDDQVHPPEPGAMALDLGADASAGSDLRLLDVVGIIFGVRHGEKRTTTRLEECEGKGMGMGGGGGEVSRLSLKKSFEVEVEVEVAGDRGKM